MSIKIDSVPLYQGDSLFLQFNGSAECCLFVEVTSDGRFVLSGPMNSTNRKYEVNISGIVLVPRCAECGTDMVPGGTQWGCKKCGKVVDGEKKL